MPKPIQSIIPSQFFLNVSVKTQVHHKKLEVCIARTLKRRKQPRSKKSTKTKHKASKGAKRFIQYMKQNPVVDRQHSSDEDPSHFNSVFDQSPHVSKTQPTSNKPIITPNGELLTLSDFGHSSINTSDSDMSSSSSSTF